MLAAMAIICIVMCKSSKRAFALQSNNISILAYTDDDFAGIYICPDSMSDDYLISYWISVTLALNRC